ncbi:MAG: HD domain-containing protein [Eubacteriales bacterium]|nr:HD domain-containing protein [Eubacteriales bacterium]
MNVEEQNIRRRPKEQDSFMTMMSEMERDPRVQLLCNYSQHQGNTTYQHCKNVAMTSYRLAEKLHLRIDGKSLAVGAMLHDYYLYNTRDMETSGYQHGINHPKIALENARKQSFVLNEREKNIIESHMWPLTLTALPKGREALLVSMADKYCALREMVNGVMRRPQVFA